MKHPGLARRGSSFNIYAETGKERRRRGSVNMLAVPQFEDTTTATGLGDGGGADANGRHALSTFRVDVADVGVTTAQDVMTRCLEAAQRPERLPDSGASTFMWTAQPTAPTAKTVAKAREQRNKQYRSAVMYSDCFIVTIMLYWEFWARWSDMWSADATFHNYVHAGNGTGYEEEWEMSNLPLMPHTVGMGVCRMFAYWRITHFVASMSTAYLLRYHDGLRLLRIFTALTSPKDAVACKIPFLNLRLPENCVSWKNIRTYIIEVHNRRANAVYEVTNAFLVGAIGLLSSLFFTAVVFAGHERRSVGGPIDAITDPLATMLAIYIIVLSTCFLAFCLTGVEMHEEMRSHLVGIGYERWKLELKRFSLPRHGTLSAQILQCDTLLHKIERSMERGDEPPTLLGIALTTEFRSWLVALLSTGVVTYIGLLFEHEILTVLGVEVRRTDDGFDDGDDDYEVFSVGDRRLLSCFQVER